MVWLRRYMGVFGLAMAFVALRGDLSHALGMFFGSAIFLVFEYGHRRTRPRLRGLYFFAAGSTLIWGVAAIAMAIASRHGLLALITVCFVLIAFRGLRPRSAGWTWVALWFAVMLSLGWRDFGGWTHAVSSMHLLAIVTVGRYAYHLDPLDFAGIPRARRRAAALPHPK